MSSDTIRPSRITHVAVHRGGDRLVVGDHDDGGSVVGEARRAARRCPRRPRSRGCPSARRRTPRQGGRPPPGRSPPAAARRRTTGRAGGRVCRRGRPGRARRPPPSRRCPAGVPSVEQAERHVLHRVQVVEQVELLEDEAETAGAQPGHGGVGKAGDLLAADPHAAPRRPFQRARDVQQRCLARAGRPDDRGSLAGAGR